MIRKSIQELEENDILAMDVLSSDYKIVLTEGIIIKREYIKRLQDMGITDVYVKEPGIDEAEILILKKEIRENVSGTLKNVLERHTYRKNDELVEIVEAADDIIENILEEDRVVGKIFDIKERSADIYEHSINICALSILTALKLDVEISVIHSIGVGCLLHDIGLRYMTVDYDNRDVATLDKKSLMEYKKHPAYGYSALLSEDWISDMSKNIILFHHERNDGSGFPLRTSKIPFECQIVNVCDTFDEMICGIACERVKVHEAIEYLKSFQNILFDGRIVDVFLSFTAVYPVGTHVLTSEGERAVVISQNKEFQNRPVIRILKDKDGRDTEGIVIKDLVKINNVFIEKTVD